MALEHRLDLLEVALGRRDAGGGSHHRLSDEAADGLRPLLDDLLLQRSSHAPGKLTLALAGLPLPEVMPLLGVQEAGQRQPEGLVHERQAGEVGRDAGDAVIAHAPRNHLALLGLAAAALIHPGELDVGVVRLRTRACVENAAHVVRQQVHEPVAQPDLLLVGVARHGVEVGKAPGLVGDRLADLAPPVARVDAEERSHRVDIGVALVVGDVDAVAVGDDMRAGFLVLVDRGEGVERRLHIHLLEAEIGCGLPFHRSLPSALGVRPPRGVGADASRRATESHGTPGVLERMRIAGRAPQVRCTRIAGRVTSASS